MLVCECVSHGPGFRTNAFIYTYPGTLVICTSICLACNTAYYERLPRTWKINECRELLERVDWLEAQLDASRRGQKGLNPSRDKQKKQGTYRSGEGRKDEPGIVS